MSVMAAHLCHNKISIYLDDWLLTGRSHQEVPSTTTALLKLLLSLGICVDKDESILVPTQMIELIRGSLNSVTARAYLPKDRFLTVKALVAHTQASPQTLVGHVLLS